jgi:hypothetical protein
MLVLLCSVPSSFTQRGIDNSSHSKNRREMNRVSKTINERDLSDSGIEDTENINKNKMVIKNSLQISIPSSLYFIF